ncbi:hypothetical protein HN51_054465 [Arachis hypogaea]
MAKVIKTNSVEYMPFWLSLTNFLNGVCWTTYALIHPFDIYVLSLFPTSSPSTSFIPSCTWSRRRQPRSALLERRSLTQTARFEVTTAPRKRIDSTTHATIGDPSLRRRFSTSHLSSPQCTEELKTHPSAEK